MDWKPAIQRVLMTYPAGNPNQLIALECLITAAVDRLRQQTKDELAAHVCEGKHLGPPTGIVCKACSDAELALLAAQKSTEPAAQTPEAEAIAKDVQKLLDLPLT